MSVQDLETQIAHISQDIERQKQVLRKLERSKGALQRQLNTIRDPIARLPAEISSEIFLQCLPSDYPQSGIHHMPITLLNVCTNWTDITLSTTGLWTAIRVVFPCSKGFCDVLEGWFQRARSHLLDLRVDVMGASDKDVGALIRRQSGQLNRLELRFENEHDPDHLIFHETDLEPLPFLQNLSIASRDGIEVSWTPILQILRRSPNLIDLSLQDLHLIDTSSSEDSTEPIVCPNLRRFLFTRNPFDLDSDDQIFQLIRAPGLESLILHDMHFQSTEFVPFLKRSSTMLQELSFDCLHIRESLDQMDEFLGLVPSIARLIISFPPLPILQRLASNLAKHPVEALPNLQSLELRFYSDDLSVDSPWTVLLPVLLDRCSKFKSLRITVHEGQVLDELEAELVTPLRGLSAVGIDIWVGTVKENLFNP
ncbi:hypothetical protein FB45DRAFT_359585 [Roridomyces roridus]|uniref:F-box domain-containing protein n=1 Tax=Roridomyces roridus TaxID=1738132 RepID=A0AAD7C7U2_9AGAR|nr:hypothetical protein FB45DRAFT_359585 [Roridomyces roridus]